MTIARPLFCLTLMLVAAPALAAKQDDPPRLLASTARPTVDLIAINRNLEAVAKNGKAADPALNVEKMMARTVQQQAALLSATIR